MGMLEYHISLGSEFISLRNRVRNLMRDPHWLTDGEWKESVLRTMLRKHMPAGVVVGRGFIFTPEECSNQIDVLIYKSSSPIIFRDGDLVFVTPDAVIGIIEVKSAVNIRDYKVALRSLGMNLAFLKRAQSIRPGVRIANWKYFAGLFCYEANVNRPMDFCAAMNTLASGDRRQVIDLAVLGPSYFIRFWGEAPPSGIVANQWSIYKLEDLAMSYFISNVVGYCSPESIVINARAWYPLETKETRRVGSISLSNECR